MSTKRKYTAAVSNRCQFDIVLRDGSGARCMRKAVRGKYCQQHFLIAKAKDQA